MSARGRRGGLAPFLAFAAGVGVGAAAEELLYRRVFGGPDPEAGERFGSVRGEPLWVTSFDGTRLYAEAFGPEGAPGCVFAHGFTLSHDIWHYQLRDLAADGRLRLVAFDARGHGRSGPARGPLGTTDFRAETLARDLSAVLEGSGIGPAVVCGHSMGGVMAQAFAALEDLPEDLSGRVRGFVLVCTTFTSELGVWRPSGPRLPRLRSRVERAVERVTRDPRLLDRLRLPPSDLAMLLTRLGFGKGASPSHVAFTRRLMERCPTETIAAAMAGLADFDTLDGLGAIDVPVLICAGGRDLVTPAFLADEMARRIPRAEVVVYPDAGHMVMLERHAELTEALRGFSEKALAPEAARA